jgi:hypothetical protein
MTADVADPIAARLRPGTRIKTRRGRRVVVREAIGGGGEGTVFRGECDGQALAVKVLHRRDAGGQRLPRTRAIIDRDIGKNIDSRIAAPFDAFEFEGRLGHISRFVAGITIAGLADEPARLNPRQRAIATVKLGALLNKFHQAGLAFGDFNKGAVKVDARGDKDVVVALVDLDSAVIPGVPLPPTLGAPDTAAPELRRERQPRTVRGWQRADWTAFAHIAADLLLYKTAGCGIDDPGEYERAFYGVPPFLSDSPRGREVDRAAGYPSASLPPDLRRQLARLFDEDPEARDGAVFVKSLAAELVNNHQVGCIGCGAAFFTYDGLRACPMCAFDLRAPLRLTNASGRTVPLDRPLLLTRELVGGSPYVSRRHARIFSIGPVTFVASLSEGNGTRILRAGLQLQLPLVIHVPLLAGDRIQLGGPRGAELLVTNAP